MDSWLWFFTALALILLAALIRVLNDTCTERAWRRMAERTGFEIEMLAGVKGRIRLSGMYRGRELHLVVQGELPPPPSEPRGPSYM